MQAVLTGVFTIAAVIFAGWLAAHLGLLDGSGRVALSNAAFFLASPALLFTIMARASLGHVLSMTFAVSALSVAVAAAAYLVAVQVWWPRTTAGERVVGAMASCYTNAGNLGLPIAAYVLGDVTWMAPILLMQLTLLQPTCLTILDLLAARRDGRQARVATNLLLPLRNPITVGALTGLVVNVSGVGVPDWLWQPLDLLGGMAVPAMLVAFGISLRLDPKPGRGGDAAQVWGITAIKVVLHPAVAFVLSRFVFALGPAEVLAVTVAAALPSAQNIFVISDRYGFARLMARDAIFWTTLLSVPVIIVLAVVIR
ncbi:AEC family transporter [Propionicicella superfundia]|uniref:AEC family transporter n=1 Tax=Propionicicella superfundia TaxID=348582 RepID=UPI000403CD11|nr:AEC family transporter [Propionicicella superfundia]